MRQGPVQVCVHAAFLKSFVLPTSYPQDNLKLQAAQPTQPGCTRKQPKHDNMQTYL
jgi:hypothetical protein